MKSHLQKGGGRVKQSGFYLDPEEAHRVVRAAISAPDPQEGCVYEEEGCMRAGEQLHMVDAETRCVFGRGSGVYLPKSGCMSDPYFYDAWRRMKPLYRKEKHLLLPAVFVTPAFVTPSKEEADVLDCVMRDYVDSETMVRWRSQWGFPTSVLPMTVIFQGGKPRVIVDLRYVNGSVERQWVRLTSVLEIASAVRPGDLMSKQDMKAGYHQMRHDPSSRHLACVIWRGALYAFTCETFGWRNAPYLFQGHVTSLMLCVGSITGSWSAQTKRDRQAERPSLHNRRTVDTEFSLPISCAIQDSTYIS